MTGPVCSVFGSAEADDTGSYYCNKLPCNWRTEYCDGDVERDEAGFWACMGTCKARTATKNDTCLCQTVGNNTASGIYPPDSSNAGACFFGERLDSYMWSGGDAAPANTTNTGEYWASRTTFENAFGQLPISLYSYSPYWPAYQDANSGYKLTKSAFLTTNCPVVSDTVWLGDRAAAPAGRRLLTTPYTSDGYDQWGINACACSKTSGKWVGSYKAGV